MYSSESRRSGVRAARFALLTLTLRPRIRLKGDVRGQPPEGRGGAEQADRLTSGETRALKYIHDHDEKYLQIYK